MTQTAVELAREAIKALQGIETQFRRIADALEAKNEPETAKKAFPEPQRPMTYREAIAQFASHNIGSGWAGGVRGCPGDHFLGALTSSSCDHDLDCKDCWDAEYKEEPHIGIF